MKGAMNVLVLGGGPDAEHDVSLSSSAAVAKALTESGCRADRRVIKEISAGELKAFPGDVIFPVLHGPWGEGGPLQDLLERGGRPYVGCGPRAARLAMDKVATKMAALTLGIPTAPSAVFNPRDEVCPLASAQGAFEPVVLKPVHEGSSVGVHICRTIEDWRRSVEQVRRDLEQHPRRVYMVERGVLSRDGGEVRELTVAVLDGQALPVIHIRPGVEFYDYQAKYHRDDTKYIVDPPLPKGVREKIQSDAVRLAQGLGVRHVCRVDFLLDPAGTAWLLEVNTMPGFTDHSLVPMAAAAAGMKMPALCRRLVELAVQGRA